MSIAVDKSKYGSSAYSIRSIIYGHLIGWAIYISFELRTLYLVNVHLTSRIDVVAHYLLNAGIFYFNCLVVFPKAYRGKTIIEFRLLIGILFEIALYFSSGQLPINEEIEQINNLELNQLRFNGELQIKFDEGFIPPSFNIPPLLLISLVENIFKYGELYDPLNPAVLSINEIDGLLQFRSKM